MSRHKGRERAFQAIFAWEAGCKDTQQLLTFSWQDTDKSCDSKAEEEEDNTLVFARLLFSGTLQNLDKIDTLIKSHLAKTWTIQRINKVSLAILRISVYSLLFQKEMPPNIIIDQAINLTKKFGEDNAYKFVNATLDAIKTDIQLKETQT